MPDTRNYRITTPDGVDEEREVFIASMPGGALMLSSYDDTGTEIHIRGYSPIAWKTIEEFTPEPEAPVAPA